MIKAKKMDMGHDFQLSIKFLKAGAGDSILIRYFGTDNKFHNLLIDGGARMAYPQNLRKEVLSLSEGEILDLIIVTHHDDDHAKGIERMLKEKNGKKFPKDLIGTMWINALIDPSEEGTSISAKTAKSITDRIQETARMELGFKILAGQKYEYGGAVLDIISPTEEIRSLWDKYFEEELRKLEEPGISRGEVYCDHDEELDTLKTAKEEKDSSISNASSIAFILTIGDFVGLFLGDARPEEVANQLVKMGKSTDSPLEVDLFKLSHHGGFKNISEALLDLVKAKNYVISSVGKTKCKPAKRTVAKILKSKHFESETQFIFNYPSENYEGIFSPEEIMKLNLFYSTYDRGHLWTQVKPK